MLNHLRIVESDEAGLWPGKDSTNNEPANYPALSISALATGDIATSYNQRAVPGLVVIAFALGLGGGLLLSRYFPDSPGESRVTAATAVPTVETGEAAAPIVKVTMANLYELPVSYGCLGPQLLAAGAIDFDRFVQIYDEAGQPLTKAQLSVLRDGSDSPIVINRESAYFLLNVFGPWG